MERCGISWIIRILNEVHKIMFGKEVPFQPEMSRSIACTNSYILPKGWYSVYNVSPESLLKCGYDKVVSIQRPFETICRVFALYYKRDLTYEECLVQYPMFFTQISKYYEKTYGKIDQISDNRYKNFLLDDLNNYSLSEFNKLLTFLGFPEENRPILFPVNPPERNWQAYSSVLDSGRKITQRLQEIDDNYKNKLLEYEIQQNYLFELNEKINKLKTEKPITIVRKPLNVKVPVPRLTTRERKIQNNRKFRIDTEGIIDPLEVNDLYKILIITPVGYGLGCHLGENMKWAFEQLGHEVQSVSYKELIQNKLLPKQILPISEIIKKFNIGGLPDFVFINEMHCKLFNDLELPTFYFHTGWYLPLGIRGKNIINYFRQSELPKGYDTGKRINKTMFHAVNPTYFYPEEKTIKGVKGIGFRRWWDNWRNIVKDFTPIIDMMEWETNQFMQLGYEWFPTPIDDHKYRELLRKMEAIQPLIGYTEFVSRRMMEAMACKTLYVYRLDFVVDKEGKRDYSIHRNMLEHMGYRAGEHYIEIQNNYDIKRAWEDMTEHMKEEMREKAYKLTMENHTHLNRAEQVIKDFESEEWKNGEN